MRHRERFLTVESKQLRATKREVECELDYGHFGNSRRVRDSNTGSQTGSIAGNEVASDALRLLHRVPLNGSFSYIAHEQIGRLSSSCDDIGIHDLDGQRPPENHQHSGIGFQTPANVHYGHAAGVARERSATLAEARAKHPDRFTTTTDPKILALPGPAWINQPKETTEQSAA